MSNKEWTDKDREMLTVMVEQKYSYPEIARKLNRGLQAVKYMAAKMGLRESKAVPAGMREPKDKPWTEKEDALLLAMCREKKSVAERCARLKRTERAVLARVQKLGIFSMIRKK